MTSSPRRTRLPAVVLVLAAGTFLMGTSEFVVAGLLPGIARDLHVDVAEAGLAITAFALGMVVGTPLMVLLTLRLPRRTTLAVALAVFAAGHVVAALADGLPLLLAARFLTAVATGAFWAVASLVAADAAGPAAGSRALGAVQAGGMLANVLGVPIGALAGQVLGWRGPFEALAVLAVVAIPVVLRAVRQGERTGKPPTIRGELAALRSGRLALVLLTCACTTGGVLSVFSYIAPLLTGRTGLPEPAIPLALVLFGVAALTGTLVGGRLGDVRPGTTMLGAAGATLLVVAALGPLSTSPAATLVLFAALGLTGLSANPVLGYLAIRSGGSAPTLASAMIPSAFNAGTAAGTAITSAALGSALGDLAPVVVGTVGAAAVVVAVTALLLTGRPRRPSPAAP